MATISFTSIRTSIRTSFFSSPETPTPQLRSPLLFQPYKSRTPLSLSISQDLPPPLPKAISSISSDLDVSLINPQRRILKSRLAAGKTLYGLFLLSFSPTIAEIAGFAGYDYVVIDMEHGPGDVSEALSCIRALAATGTPAVLRLPEASAAWAKKALDLGPHGIMFPSIETAEAAELAVAYCRYPPRGVRGSAHTVVRASAYGLDDSYLSRCEEDLLIMCQVETLAGVKEIGSISAVEGVDVIQMGPLDLSASMGYLWDPGNRKVRQALKEAESRVLDVKNKDKDERKVYLGGFAMPHDPPEQLKLRGYHMVSGAVDVGIFRKVLVEDVKRFRRVGMETGEDWEDEEEGKEKYGYWSE